MVSVRVWVKRNAIMTRLADRLPSVGDVGGAHVAVPLVLDQRKGSAMGGELSRDQAAVLVEVTAAQSEGREISDACARVIASWFSGGDGTDGYAFVSTGAIPGDGYRVYRSLVGDSYQGHPAWLRVALDMLGTYLVRAGERGPVFGWSALWVC